jgi:ion channel-forming bestrophin family protein
MLQNNFFIQWGFAVFNHNFDGYPAIMQPHAHEHAPAHPATSSRSIGNTSRHGDGVSSRGSLRNAGNIIRGSSVPLFVPVEPPVIMTEQSSLHLDKYNDYPLVQSMLQHEKTRRTLLDKIGSKQRNATKSTDGWIKTMMEIEGRALDNILLPWMLCTANATIWSIVAQQSLAHVPQKKTDSWEFFFGIVLNTSLSFLLVFRLNRAAERFWLARENWGTIVGVGRFFASGMLVHGAHQPVARDNALRWICAYAIATMQFIRSTKHIPPESLAGILTEQDVLKMQHSIHPPIYAAHQVRDAMKVVFSVTTNTPLSLAHAWTQQMTLLEEALNRMMDQEGAMERIRSSPLPLVYVAHLRTFVLFFLLALPYIWYASWGWATIPLVSVTAFALLGLDGAASECEAPFRQDRPNHLNMGAFCQLLLSNIQQMIQSAADQELEKQFDGNGGARQSDGMTLHGNDTEYYA